MINNVDHKKQLLLNLGFKADKMEKIFTRLMANDIFVIVDFFHDYSFVTISVSNADSRGDFDEVELFHTDIWDKFEQFYVLLDEGS